MKCKICNNSNSNKIYQVREMMLGLRDEFTYFQCANCECLQINEIPSDISKYYPTDYYSFNVSVSQKARTSIRRLISNIRNRHVVFKEGFIGALISRFYPKESLQMLSHLSLTKRKKILDVGCGTGSLLHSLKEIGFESLLGIDPFIEEDIAYENGLKITKQSIHDLNSSWDVIMFHHSFEHMGDPLEILKSVSRLLNTGGVCLIRIPTVSSYAWEHYRENWVGLDAPRHFFLHSQKSINQLISNLDLTVEKIIDDSNDFQFWGSEQYIKNIPLSDTRTHSIFSKETLSGYKKRAKELNKNRQGDTCGFILRKG